MLLDKNVVEVDKLVSDEVYLREKVSEAYNMLASSAHQDPAQ